jgi:hypothetical protein
MARADSLSSPFSSQANEGRKIAIQVDQPVEVDHHSHEHHDHARPDFNLAEMRLEPLQESAKLVEAEAKEQKWKIHAKRGPGSLAAF